MIQRMIEGERPFEGQPYQYRDSEDHEKFGRFPSAAIPPEIGVDLEYRFHGVHEFVEKRSARASGQTWQDREKKGEREREKGIYRNEKGKRRKRWTASFGENLEKRIAEFSILELVGVSLFIHPSSSNKEREKERRNRHDDRRERGEDYKERSIEGWWFSSRGTNPSRQRILLTPSLAPSNHLPSRARPTFRLFFHGGRREVNGVEGEGMRRRKTSRGGGEGGKNG